MDHWIIPSSDESLGCCFASFAKKNRGLSMRCEKTPPPEFLTHLSFLTILTYSSITIIIISKVGTPIAIMAPLQSLLHALSLSALATATQNTNPLFSLDAQPPLQGVVKSQGCFNTTVLKILATTKTPALSYYVSHRNHPRGCSWACVEQSPPWKEGDVHRQWKRERPVAALQGNACVCGDLYPPLETSVDVSYCDFPCPGDPRQACGGLDGYTSVFNTGYGFEQHVDVRHIDEENYERGLESFNNSPGTDSEKQARTKPATPPVLGQHTSQGCYTIIRDPNGALLDRHPDLSNTPGVCSARCATEGRPVAAVHGRMCFCSDTYPERSMLAPDESCQSPCLGESDGACGGRLGFHWSVYNTGLQLDVKNLAERKPEDFLVDTVTEINQDSHFAYKGCFAANQDPTASKIHRSLYHAEYLHGGFCSELCYERRQFVASVQGEDCYCSDVFPPRSAMADEASCDLPCPGHIFAACGSPEGFVSVYHSDKKNTVKHLGDINVRQDAVLGESTPQGCFNRTRYFSGWHVNVHNTMSQNTPASCNVFCRDDRKSPVALLDGDVCYCSDIYPPREDLVDDAFCSTPCHGDASLTCGNTHKFLSVWNTGVRVDVPHLDDGEDESDESESEGNEEESDEHTGVTKALMVTLVDGVKEITVKADEALDNIETTFDEWFDHTEPIQEAQPDEEQQTMQSENMELKA